MSHIAKCGRCGASMARNKHHSAGSRFDRYVCGKSGHLSVRLDQLDWYADRVLMKRRLSDPDVYATLMRHGDSGTAAKARAEIEQAELELESLFRDQKAGLVSARAATVEERRENKSSPKRGSANRPRHCRPSSRAMSARMPRKHGTALTSRSSGRSSGPPQTSRSIRSAQAGAG